MRAIAQKLDATIRHKRVANCWRCAIPARVRAIVGHEDRGREGRALWIAVISPARTRAVSNPHHVHAVAAGAPEHQTAALNVPQDSRSRAHTTNPVTRSEEHTSALQSLMRISYAVFCLKTKKYTSKPTTTHT